MTYSHGTCAICDERHDFLMALHGDKGGPACCLLCRGKWHAEYGKRRRLGRIVIRAMLAFIEGGGHVRDLDKLKLTAISHNVFDLDPLGYMAGAAKIKDEVIEMTSELLADTLKLVHPDLHPPERHELANKVTQGLLAIQPFVFPAPKPKPPPTYSPAASNGSAARSRRGTANPSQYPCAECASTVPSLYCTACRTEFDKRQKAERDARIEKGRQYRARRKAAKRGKCAVCGEWFEGRRRDALFCSDACRQQAHRKPSQEVGRIRGHYMRIRDERRARLARQPITMRDDKLYLGENELKLESDLEIVESRLRFKRTKKEFRPGLAWNNVSFVVDGRTRRLRLLMCEDCNGLFAARQFAWLCDPCAQAHKDKATAKRRAQRQRVTDKRHPDGGTACSCDERRKATP